MAKTSKAGMTPAQQYKAKLINRARYDELIGSKRKSAKPGKTGGKGGKGTGGKTGGKGHGGKHKGPGARNRMMRGLDQIESNAVHSAAIAKDMKRVIGKKV
jgi:hypothetical protein